MLNIKHLSIGFPFKNGVVHAVDDISFTLSKGEQIAIVGESGSGKSVTSLAILKLLDEAVVEGAVIFNNQNLLQLSEQEIEKIRGNDIAMIFQEPMNSLNPVFTVGKQIEESFLIHTDMHNPKDAVLTVLKEVGFSDVETIYHKYPHELSGGMRQRVMIAMALSCSPSILIADEPTTALDVTIQAQILDLIGNLNKQYHTSLILITHDLGIISHNVDRVLVMYHGKIIEDCPVRYLTENKMKHHYTKALLESSENMIPIEGNIPLPFERYQGCSFAPRCPFAQERCRQEKPEFTHTESNHAYACFYPYGGHECS